jgi:hypothetical protein
MPGNFSDSTEGKIFIGVVLFVATGVLSYIGGRLTAPAVFPKASLVPEIAEIEAGQTLQFSAAQSTDANGSIQDYKWSIGGFPHEQSSVGYCDITDSKIDAVCIFSTPGNFSVSVEVTNSKGKSSVDVSPVSVSMANGFVGLLLKAGSGKQEKDDAFRALLKLADWPDIQRGVSRPILLYDPDLGEPVFAASIIPAKDKSGSAAKDDSLFGVKLVVPRFSPNVKSQLSALIESHGGTLVEIPAGEIYTALTTGLSNSGFVPVSSLDQYRKLLDGGE